MIFTKEQEKLLNYDEDAFFYFAGSLLTSLLLPWTCYVVYKFICPKLPAEDDFDGRGKAPSGARVRTCGVSLMKRKQAAALERRFSLFSRLSGGVWLQLIVLCWLWNAYGKVLLRIQDAPAELATFSPYKILGLDTGAEVSQIKKAYRQKSLQLHPDKNPDNPMATVLFQQVAKAHAALTEEGPRKNWEKYGNPDGPTQTKVSVALHPAMLEKDNQLRTLCFFFFVVLMVPFSLLCCCLRSGSQLSANGVSAETLKVLHACIDEQVTAADGPSLVAASAEARRLCWGDISKLARRMASIKPQKLRAGVCVEVKQPANGSTQTLIGMVREFEEGASKAKVEVGKDDIREFNRDILTVMDPAVPCCFSDMPIRRNSALLFGHMWRQRGYMDPLVSMELDAILRHSVPIGRAATAIAANGGIHGGDRSSFLPALRAMVETQRCIVQALDVDASPLLQLPGVSEAAVSSSDAPALAHVVDEVVNGGESAVKKMMQRLGLSGDEQRLDLEAWCHHAPRVELVCHVHVKDEDGVAEGDLATFEVTMRRKNLQDGEHAGPVCAPLFPVVKFEEWWIAVFDQRARKLVTAEYIDGTGREEKVSLRFMVPRQGEFSWTVTAMCDSYSGLDVEKIQTFTAMKHSDVSHDVFVHPEDMHIKSLFEELMEGLNPEEEESEDSEDEDEREARLQRAKAKAEAEADAVSKRKVKSLLDSDDEAGPDLEPEGDFFRVTNPEGVPIFRLQDESEENRVGTLPTGKLVRVFAGEGGWVELAGGQVWIRGATNEGSEANEANKDVQYIGGLYKQKLQTLVQTPTPLRMVRRWMRRDEATVDGSDMLKVRDVPDGRIRCMLEEMTRMRFGDEHFEELMQQADGVVGHRKQRLTKATGVFQSGNGIIWQVMPTGLVRGVHADGSKIRDQVDLVEAEQGTTPHGTVSSSAQADGIHLGPFRLDESRSCACIHWIRRDDAEKQWAWYPDKSLSARLRLGPW